MPAKGQHWLFDFEKRADADDACTVMIGMGLAHITLRGRTEVRAKTLPNGVRHPIWEESDSQAYDDTREYLVPPGHYFFMGDNRDHSQDSRAMHAVGFVPFDNLVGRAEFLFFSHNDSPLWQFWRWPGSIRWGRIFNGIE